MGRQAMAAVGVGADGFAPEERVCAGGEQAECRAGEEAEERLTTKDTKNSKRMKNPGASFQPRQSTLPFVFVGFVSFVVNFETELCMNFKPAYGTSEGPLGFPMTDRQAFAVDAILRGLPKDQTFAYRKAVIERGPTELLQGDRADVSWISTEGPDRCGDVVIARGMNDGQFRLNPIVTLNHCYGQPPVGRSLWRKFVKDGLLRGIKAKTVYPARRADWTGDWPADVAFSL